MNKKIKRIIVGFGVVAVLSVTAIITLPIIRDNARKVTFADERMGNRIVSYAKMREEDFREEDLDKVEWLKTGYTGQYSTLVDIEKCKQLEKLEIGRAFSLYAEEHGYKEHDLEPESEERIQQIKKELASILKNCPKLERLDLIGQKKYFELGDVSFLRNGKRLKSLAFRCQPELDYSTLSECSNLRTLIFQGCEMWELDMLSHLNKLEHLEVIQSEVSEAGDILKLQSLTELVFADTALAGNEEQLNLILENCPDIKKLTLAYGERNGELSNWNFFQRAEKMEELTLVGYPEVDCSAISACHQLKTLKLWKCNISDFGVLEGMENLENLDLTETNISQAEDILKFKNLKYLNITDTPLAENAEQIELIQNKFPGIEIQK
ncbi:leucine-rich repeat domain-containing protein [Roseburia sp. MSJ-14]|uniref:leucine-rich repeat domain-containing protein n=1 Tax=Roseburia sp. MSJ-14 TaxID=2841514 RepID=UPI001C0FE8C6|nr:hypothetical protein [Roseburia sp. MSJ-14]MBU5474620.1 hypothetical protein [Roseburia sp. MSJ-14]